MTTIRQFSRIVLALLAITGCVTMLGISRWCGAGGSYRTVQRFFATTLPWAALFWLFFRTYLFHTDDVYLLGGDETVVTKAGTHTHGLDRFYASHPAPAGPHRHRLATPLAHTSQLSQASWLPSRQGPPSRRSQAKGDRGFLATKPLDQQHVPSNLSVIVR